MGGREMLAAHSRAASPRLAGAPPSGWLGAPPRARPRRLRGAAWRRGRRGSRFVVDELCAEQDLVVTGLGRRLRRVPNVAGCALWWKTAASPSSRARPSWPESALQAPADGLLAHRRRARGVPKRLLVADDSVTTRTLEKTILEEAGYEVRSPPDGHQARRILQKEAIDLVVADVEMPGMDGFTLTETLRALAALRRIPVVLVTSLSSDKDRARGTEAGADAYIVKSGFDRGRPARSRGPAL